MSKRLNITPEMVAGNLSISEISSRYKISHTTVSFYRRKYNIKSTVKNKQGRQNTAANIPRSALENCTNADEFAKKLGFSTPTIYKYMRMYGITPPRFNKIQEKPPRICPRCGSQNWVKEDGLHYCATPTPNDPKGFSRCWYHHRPAMVSGGAA